MHMSTDSPIACASNRPTEKKKIYEKVSDGHINKYEKSQVLLSLNPRHTNSCTYSRSYEKQQQGERI